MRLAFSLGMAIFAAPQAVAEDLSLRPESCARLATVQYENCSVTNTFRCTDQSVAFWIETVDADNILTIETRNADHGTQSWNFVGQDVIMRFSQSKAHPRDTIRNGSAKDTIEGEVDLFGVVGPVTGETSYSHAGETMTLAGESFARIAFQGAIVAPWPISEIVGGGTFLYSDKLDLLIEEEVRVDHPVAETYRLSHLALAGQDGFGDETPGYGCGQLSRLTRPIAEAAA